MAAPARHGLGGMQLNHFIERSDSSIGAEVTVAVPSALKGGFQVLGAGRVAPAVSRAIVHPTCVDGGGP